jgi:hypothetical protein
MSELLIVDGYLSVYLWKEAFAMTQLQGVIEISE